MASDSFVHALTSSNGVITSLAWKSRSPAEFLRSFPHGAYTCLRLQENVNPTKLIEFHYGRLQQSLSLIFSTDLSQSLTIATFQALLGHLVSAQDLKNSGSAFVTVLAVCDDTGIKIHGHAIGPSIPSTLKVDAVLLTKMQTVGGNRLSFPEAKASRWLEERKPLEALKTTAEPAYAEVIMCSPDGKLVLEGLITNVFVVINQTVYTANTNVLMGYMRQLVLQACKELNMQLVTEAPKVEDINNWEEVFITSTTKPVCGVGTIKVHETGEVITFNSSKTTERIQSKLQEYLVNIK